VLFEVDVEEVVLHKEWLLERGRWTPTCTRRSVVADLAVELAAPLTSAGFEHGARTVWVAEGLLAYLEPVAVQGLLRRVGDLASPRDHLGLSLRGAGAAEPEGAAARSGPPGPSYRALLRSSAPPDVVGWLEGHRWTASVFDPAERSVAYGRPYPSPASHARLVEARRTEVRRSEAEGGAGG
jgi:methyltransferase (TIGR00027 family)